LVYPRNKQEIYYLSFDIRFPNPTLRKLFMSGQAALMVKKYGQNLPRHRNNSETHMWDMFPLWPSSTLPLFRRN